MKKISILILTLSIINNVANADVKGKALDELSSKISESVSKLIPGDGLTEASIELKDNNEGNGNYSFSILGVRDIISEESYNFFTQFSLRDQQIESDKRIIGNLGFGYRFLNSDQSMMFGANTFLDQDIGKGHQRVGLGLEGKASILDFSYNEYIKTTNQKIVSGIKEQVLSGNEYNISSQLPYMPWTVFNYQGYEWDNEKAVNNAKGKIYSLEMQLTPSLMFNVEQDNSSVEGEKNQHNYEIAFMYPPQANKLSLMNGFTSNVAFEKKNMKEALKEKVRRSNNLTVEIQGAVVVTRK